MTDLQFLSGSPEAQSTILPAALEETVVSPAIPSALIVHDNPDMRRLFRSVLIERLGMSRVIEADSVDAAVEHLAEANEIGLAIISFDLRGMEACVTVGLIREHFPKVRVVVASSRRDNLAVLRPLAAGAHGLIDISTSLDDHAEALELVLRGRVAVPSWLPDFRFKTDD
jgi:DNA-binding NarL/FixJ family response regulator